MKKNILSDLDRMITKVAAEKQAALKQASPGDDVEDGTKKPETGAQMASNKSEAGKHTAAKVDGGAKTNPSNASVEMSTDGSTAVATDGQSGTKGADLEVKHQAANGPEGGIKGDDKKTAAAPSLIDELRKAAAAEESAAAPTKTEKTAVSASAGNEPNGAMSLLNKVLGKTASAQQQLTPFECFLVKAARANLKQAADGMSDQQVAGDTSDKLLQALQSGSVSEEDAEKMLTEAVQSGAITEQDLMQAMQQLQGQGGGDPAGAGAGTPPADAGAGGAPMGAGPGPSAGPGAGGDPAAGAAMGAMGSGPDQAAAADPMGGMGAKMAAADVGPEHPEYIKKLAALYRSDMEAGYEFAVKLAEELSGDDGDDDKGKDSQPADKSGDAGKPQETPSPAQAPAAPPAAPGADAGMGAGAMGAGPGAMGDPGAAVHPKSEEEKQALLQVLAEMGIKPEDLQQLLAAPVQAPADPAAAKLAAYRTKVRTVILTKVAALQEAGGPAK